MTAFSKKTVSVMCGFVPSIAVYGAAKYEALSCIFNIFFLLVNFVNVMPAEGRRQLQPQLPASRSLPSTDGTQTKREISLVCRRTRLT